MAKKAKVKVKGVVLLEAFLALLLMAMASYGLASVNSVQFSQMAAGRESDSAKNYAELEAEYLKSLGFDAVVTNNKDDDDPSRTPRYPDGEQSSVDKASNARDMTKFLGDTLGSEWRSTATLGKTINNINGDSDNKIQNIVVSVYKKSDGDNASPRATVTLPLSSQSNGGEAIGTIIPRLNDNFKSASEAKHYLLCDGSSFSATEYPKLAALIGTILPDLRGQFLQGADSLANANKKIEAGLPNITGVFSVDPFAGSAAITKVADGAFTTENFNAGNVYISAIKANTIAKSGVQFDASRSSNIYGNSLTVQPPALTVRYYIRAK